MNGKKFEIVTLTPAQEKLWSETRVALLWHCPAFTHILYSLMTDGKDVALFTKDIPIAATDGKYLMLNPDTFFKYTLPERVFAIAHEIAHCIFDHMGQLYYAEKRGKVTLPDGKTFDLNPELLNIAADYVINDMLIESKVGQFNKDWLHDKNVATHTDSFLDVYGRLYKKQPPKGGGGGQGPSGIKGKAFDQHLAPGSGKGQDPGQAAQDRNPIQWANEVAAAMSSAKVQGKLPAAMERMFKEILEPQVPWQEHIRSIFARKVGSGSFTWNKPDRRFIVRGIIAPGRSGFGAGDVVIAVDTSGSIRQKELDTFFPEIAGILEDVKPERVFIVWCDAAVGRVDEVEETGDLYEVQKKGAPGGGGTSFIPVFDWIEENEVKPDALVYLTDGYGAFPDPARAKYPVIWGNISGPNVQYPFGDVVDIKIA